MHKIRKFFQGNKGINAKFLGEQGQKELFENNKACFVYVLLFIYLFIYLFIHFWGWGAGGAMEHATFSGEQENRYPLGRTSSVLELLPAYYRSNN